MEAVKHTETNHTSEILQSLRAILDRRQLQSTPERRTVAIIQLIMTESLYEDDSLQPLLPFIPKPEQLTGWYAARRQKIDQLRTEDRHKDYTYRYDLEQDVVPYADSAWISLSKRITSHLSMSTEAGNADIAIKLMCQEAVASYQDTLHELGQVAAHGIAETQTPLPTAS